MSIAATAAATPVKPNSRGNAVSNKLGNFGVKYGKRHSKAAEMEVRKVLLI